MQSSQEQKAAIDFDKVKKYDAAGKLDVAATLGEIVKATFNQAVDALPVAKETEILELNFVRKITGTLRVSLSVNRKDFIEKRLKGQDLPFSEGIYIESDNPDDSLQKLTLWLGSSLEREEKPKGFFADTQIFDRQFILPYLQNFLKELAGQYPYDVFLLNEFHIFAQGYRGKLQFDEKFVPVVDSWQQVTLKLRDGTLIHGHGDLNKRMDNAMDWTSDLVQQLQNLRQLGRTLEFRRERRGNLQDKEFLRIIKAYLDNFKYDKDPLVYLDKWVEEYKKITQHELRIPSLFEEYRKGLADWIVANLFPRITPADMIKQPQWRGEKTKLQNLLLLPDRDIFNALMIKMENVDLNHLSWHPLIWCFTNRDLDDLSGRMDIDPNLRHLAPIEKEWFIGRLLDQGVTITDAVLEAIERRKIDPVDVQIFYGQAYPRYKAAADALEVFLPRDSAGITLGYLAGEAFVARARSTLPVDTTGSAQNRNRLLAPPSKVLTPEEAKLKEQFDKVIAVGDAEQGKPLFDAIQVWLAKGADLLGFQDEMKKAKDEISKLNFPSACEETVLATVLKRVHELAEEKGCPDMIKDQAKEIVEKMRQRFTRKL